MAARDTIGQTVLLWFGLLAAPLAWGLQHWTGVALAIAACGAHGAGVAVNAISAVVAALAALVAAAGLAASLAVWRATRDPGGVRESRVHFMATMGVPVSVLMLCIIVMSGFGASLLDRCVQS